MVGVWLKNCFWVHSCSCSTFVLYVSVNSDISFYLLLGSFSTFCDSNRLLLGLSEGSTTVFGSTHAVEQLSFSIFLSILTFDFDLIFGSFLIFWGPNKLLLGLEKGSKIVLGYTHLVEQLSFSTFSLILTFEFYFIWGHFQFFWSLMGYFLGWGRVRKLFWGLLM